MGNDELRPIPGYSGYSVTRDGRIMGKRGKWMSPAVGYSGHLSIAAYHNGFPSSFGVHCAVLLAWVGPCPPGMECCHGDGNPGNNCVENLTWGTHSKNMGVDRLRDGTLPCGEKQWKAKLVESDVHKIRELLKAGYSCREVAARYGVTQGTIGHIKTGRNWSWLQ